MPLDGWARSCISREGAGGVESRDRALSQMRDYRPLHQAIDCIVTSASARIGIAREHHYRTQARQDEQELAAVAPGEPRRIAGIACVPPEIAVVVARVETAVQEARRPGRIDPILRQHATCFVDATIEVQPPESEQ